MSMFSRIALYPLTTMWLGGILVLTLVTENWVTKGEGIAYYTVLLVVLLLVATLRELQKMSENLHEQLNETVRHVDHVAEVVELKREDKAG